MWLREWITAKRSTRAYAWALVLAFGLGAQHLVPGADPSVPIEVALFMAAMSWAALSPGLAQDFASGTALLFLRTARPPSQIALVRVAAEAVTSFVIMASFVAALSAFGDTNVAGDTLAALTLAAIALPLFNMALVMKFGPEAGRNAIIVLASFAMSQFVAPSLPTGAYALATPFLLAQILIEAEQSATVSATTMLVLGAHLCVLFAYVTSRYERAVVRSMGW